MIDIEDDTPAPFVKFKRRSLKSIHPKAPPDADPLASCSGKIPYPTYRAAFDRMQHGRNKHRTVYRCRHCHQYHVGSDMIVKKE